MVIKIVNRCKEHCIMSASMDGAPKKTLLALRHKTARLNFAKEHEKKPDEYWKHILWSDETKIHLFSSDGVQHVWREPGQDYHSECIVLTVKHGGGSVMIWGCMSAKGVGEMTFIDGTMNACGYTKILADKMTPSLQKLGRRGIFQHDNNPKHTAKIMQEFLKKKKVKTMTWPSMSPDLNPIHL